MSRRRKAIVANIVGILLNASWLAARHMGFDGAGAGLVFAATLAMAVSAVLLAWSR